MGSFLDLLTLPVLGPARLVHWLSRTVAEEAQREFLDEGRLRGALLELQQKYDAGELDENEYDSLEKTLMEQIAAIREFKEQLAKNSNN